MICQHCGTDTVTWRGPLHDLNGTVCSSCGGLDCQRVEPEYGTEEGETCGRAGCTGLLSFREPENCSCHIAPPCWECAHAPLRCDECGWEAGAP